ncbi:tRNA 2-thiouridine(34) synthase MnmA [Chlamydiifrater phoenicopteri]|uniref:tRNA 2-thiouridine(34) synthase MnmA n=1 Tax=Chlamydiifrater phoenicopteri TaxID=2681469 RepID=UPI001BCCFD29|nr:tRNA 2-thiouridine(34) synthase MnmA [Chlamydiifrater phoenicopteri]
MPQTVVVAMSGGVDSSVAAYLLKTRTSYRVVGLFMKNWDEEDSEAGCNAASDYRDVADVCDALNIPHYTVSFSTEYKDRVFSQFLEGYSRGITPNPDVLCNREIKFDLLLKKALDLSADFLATGHYCQLVKKGSEMLLARGKDKKKDQSYFLSGTPVKALQKVLFPVGGLEKSEVRSIAERAGLSTASKKDSTGICFIGKRDFRSFLGGYIQDNPGKVVDVDSGKIIGTHRGLHYYTFGQRRGLDIGGRESPLYVVGKDVEGNILYVTEGENSPFLYRKELIARNPNWILQPNKEFFSCTAKVRYRSEDEGCSVCLEEDNTLRIVFEAPVKAVTPGQTIAFYEGDICLGGATIDIPMTPQKTL